MQVTTKTLNLTRSQRAASILELETNLVRRFRQLLHGWLQTEKVGQAIVEEMSTIKEFGESFVEEFHYRRVELVLARCEAAGDRRLAIWAAQFSIRQDRLRERLEGMRVAVDSADSWSLTAFRWSTAALEKALDRYLNWAEESLLPELRVRIPEALDSVIATDLELDQVSALGHYAQAENLLLELER